MKENYKKNPYPLSLLVKCMISIPMNYKDTLVDWYPAGILLKCLLTKEQCCEGIYMLVLGARTL